MATFGTQRPITDAPASKQIKGNQMQQSTHENHFRPRLQHPINRILAVAGLLIAGTFGAMACDPGEDDESRVYAAGKASCELLRMCSGDAAAFEMQYGTLAECAAQAEMNFDAEYGSESAGCQDAVLTATECSAALTCDEFAEYIGGVIAGASAYPCKAEADAVVATCPEETL